MRRTGYLVLPVLFVCLVLCAGVVYCADSSGEDTESEIGRYQIYTTQAFTVLLDTKTGKVWRLSADMSGKIKGEGVTVEGLAYSSSDADTLNNKLKDINLEKVSDKNKKQCEEALLAEFSYRLDADKIDKILKYYKEK